MNAFPAFFGFARVAPSHRHVKINCWKIPEHVVTDVYIFMLLYLYVEILKEFDIVIQEKTQGKRNGRKN